jgi:large subunit ribosomal protein L32e
MAGSYARPRFVREESWRYKRVKEAWRAPHGKTSRVRRSKKGWPAVVKIGYSHDKTIRGIHPSGLRDVRVWRPEDLKNIDPKTQVARIAHTVGESKRVLIIEEAKKINVRILNPGLKKAPTIEAAPPPEPEAETAPEVSAEVEKETAEAEPARKRAKKAKKSPAKKRKTRSKK